MRESPEGSYYISFYLAKPTEGAVLEVARPALEPLSEKAATAPRALPQASPVMARIVPIDPLLSEIDAASAVVTYYYGGVLKGSLGDYRIESSLGGGRWVSAQLPESRRVTVNHGAVAPGKYKLNVRLVSKAPMPASPCGAP